MISLVEYYCFEKECFLYFPTENDMIVSKMRRYFEGQVIYTAEELSVLESFKKEIPQSERWSNTMMLRMLYATKFKFPKTLQALLAYDEWRAQCIPPKCTLETMRLLEEGAMYVHGRDNRFRPILVMNVLKLASNIDTTLSALTYFLEHTLQHYMLPGQIESWVVVLDLGGLSVGQLPSSQLKQITGYLSSNYRSRMHCCYVINCPTTIKLLWSAIKSFLEESTANKVQFERTAIAANLFKHVNPQQVECKYGGKAVNKVGEYWPPKPVSAMYQVGDDIIKLISVAEYNELYRNGGLQNNRVCMELIQCDMNTIDNKQQVEDDDGFQSCEDEQ